MRMQGKPYLLAEVDEELVCFCGVQCLARGELDAQLLLEGLDHIISLPGCLEIHHELFSTLAFWVVRHDGTSVRQVLDHPLKQVLRNLHDVVHIRVCHIEFTECELGIVGKIDTFVSEHTTNLVHAIKPADGKLLEVQLRRNAEVQVEVKIVVMRDKGLRGRTTSKHTRDGCLNFEETEVVEVPPNVIDNLGASDENTTGIVREDEV